jgi:glucose uptake protein GlcU
MPMPTGMFILPYSSPLFWSLPMLFLIACELTADFLGKQWTIRKRKILFMASITMYMIGNVFWLFAVLNGVGLARGTLIFTVGQQITAAIMGIFYFKEKLTRRQEVGMLMGILTIALMGGA